MRIGAFAEKHGQSIDTIRHYMELNLIAPEKVGGQYAFDEACDRDLDQILHFKERGFSLQEIKRVLNYQRLGKMSEHQYRCCYLDLVRYKHEGTLRRIAELERVRKLLEESLTALEAHRAERQRLIGVDLAVLGVLSCTRCGGSLQLRQGQIEDNQIVEGLLACGCGQDYPVQDGILMVPGAAEDSHETFDIADYLNQTDSDYLDSIYKGLEWFRRRVDYCGLDHQTVLELGCGIGFFLRYNHEELSENLSYVAVDRDLSAIRGLKDVLERSPVRRRVVFVCTDFASVPLRPGSVDVLVDHSGTSNYAFEHREFLIGKVLPLLSPVARVLGTYICFQKFSRRNPLSNEQRRWFTSRLIREELQRLGFAVDEEARSEGITGGGPYEDFFEPGETIYRYSLLARRLNHGVSPMVSG